MDAIKVNLTAQQLRNFQNQKPFQLSHSQLSGNSKGNHTVEIHLNPPSLTKLLKNIQGGKGFRFSPNHIVGGSLLDDIARKTKNTFRDVGNHAKDIAIDVAKDAVKSKVKKMTGLGMKRPAKGSAEAKQWGQRMKALREAKKGGKTIEGGRTYAERLRDRTRRIGQRAKATFQKVGDAFKPVGDFLTSKPVKEGLKTIGKETLQGLKDYALPIAKEVGKDALKTAVTGAMMGVGLNKRRIPVVGGAFVKGVPLPYYTQPTTDRIMTHGLHSHHRGNRNGLHHGGSFLPLG